MPSIVRLVNIRSSIEKVWDIIADDDQDDSWSLAEGSNIGKVDHECGVIQHCQLAEVSSASIRLSEWNKGARIGYDISGIEGVESMRNRIDLRAMDQETEAKISLDFETVDSQGQVPTLEEELSHSMEQSLECLKYFAETGEIMA